jgi:hypothetical protein
LFGGFNVYSGDKAKLKAQVSVWCEELEEFPLYYPQGVQVGRTW